MLHAGEMYLEFQFVKVPFQHGVTETRRKLVSGDLTGAIIGAAIEVHSALGPGLLESFYEECLCRELGLRDIGFRRQIDLPVEFIRSEARMGIPDRSHGRARSGR